MLSSTVRVSRRASRCGTNTVRAGRSTVPDVGRSQPARIETSVLLPVPDGPVTASTSAGVHRQAGRTQGEHGVAADVERARDVAGDEQRLTHRDASLRRLGRVQDDPAVLDLDRDPAGREQRPRLGRQLHPAARVDDAEPGRGADVVLGGEHAVVEVEQPVGLLGDPRVMGRVDDGGAVALGGAPQPVQHLAGPLVVEVRGRLVGDQQGAAGRHRGQQREPLLLAAGQLVDPVPGLLGEAQRAEHLVRRRVPPAMPDVVGRGEVLDQVAARPLVHERDVARAATAAAAPS